MRRNVMLAMLGVLVLTGSVMADDQPAGSMRTWIDADWLLWWISPSPAPQPLLTTGPLTNPILNGSGIVGQPSTQLLAGQSAFNTGPYNGWRINAGWINCSDTFGVEGSYFQLAQHAVNLDFGSNAQGNPLLARPIIDTRTGTESAVFVSAPNAFAGSINFGTTTSLFGADGNLLFPIVRGCCDDPFIPFVNLLAGFRYLNLADDLAMAQQSTVLPLGASYFGRFRVPPTAVLNLLDNFETHNQFYGGQVGANVGLTWWRFTVIGTGKLAIGSMAEQATINGSTNVTGPRGLNQTLPGGVLALPSNSGTYWRDEFAFIPEGTLTLNFEITAQLRLTIGYTALYVSNVARPGQIIDRNIDRAGLPTSLAFNPNATNLPHPGFTFSGTDFFANGINVGLALRF